MSYREIFVVEWEKVKYGCPWRESIWYFLVLLKNKKVEVETTTSAAPEKKIETIIEDKTQEETKATEK